jgi:ATP-dependent DNA helicase RecG
MALPVNIDDLINSRTIESSRIEFKRGWNPFNILRTVCAFSNDIDELGGGYIIIGIEEAGGIIQLPPYGLEQKSLDAIQREFFKLCNNNIREKVFPQIEAIEFQGKWIIVIWVTTGDERPYVASDSPGKKAKMVHYVRHGTVTKEASKLQIKQLQELANINYYDSRANPKANLSHLDLSLIQSYLKDTGANLFEESSSIPFEELCRKMDIIKGPSENLKPINAGLLLFSKTPSEFFPGCKTNLVVFADETGSEIDYTIEFNGPIQNQIREILQFFKSNIIKEKVTKDPFQAESQTFFNYPFQALEEVIVNSLYHRSFENPEPNQIRVFPYGPNRRIEISSFPGPLSPIDQEALLQERVPPKNRNIKLGDFLKYLKLTEKFGSGIPTVRKVLANNGSPAPNFITDDDKSHFMVVIGIHSDWNDEDSVSTNKKAKRVLSNEEQLILEVCELGLSTKEIIKSLSNQISAVEMSEMIEKLLSENFLAKKTVSQFFGLIKTDILFTTSNGKDALMHSF